MLEHQEKKVETGEQRMNEGVVGDEGEKGGQVPNHACEPGKNLSLFCVCVCVCVCVCLFRAAPTAFGGSQARG